MKILVDENIPLLTVEALRNLGNNHGMIIVRLKKPNRIKIHQRVMQAFNQFDENEWRGMLVAMRDTVQVVWKSKAVN